MEFVSYIHDPDNLYIPLLEKTEIPEKLKGSLVAVSEKTTQEVKDKITQLGFKSVKGGLYGEARKNVLKAWVEQGSANNVMVCDFDKMLHWLQTEPEEFLNLLESSPEKDVTIIARSSKALSTYPDTWVKTEKIASRVLSKLIKQNVDMMNGPYILNKEAAKTIAQDCTETGVGSCTEWVLLSYQAGYSIGNIEVDGLTWEDPDRYITLIEKSSNYDIWKYDTYDSLYEWRKRISFLNTQLHVMIRLSEEPINPKYPVVQNQTFEKS